MTGPELLAYIKRAFKRTDKDAELYEAITDTITDMRLRFSFDDFKEEVYSDSLTTLGEYKMPLPDDFNHLIGEVRILDGNDGYILTKRSKEAFDQLYPHPNASSVIKARPTDFCIFGGSIFLGPVPDSLNYLYEFSYSNEDEESITAISLSVPFSDRHREVLKYGTLRRIYADMGLDEEAIKWGQHYEAEVQKIIAKETANSEGYATTSYADF